MELIKHLGILALKAKKVIKVATTKSKNQALINTINNIKNNRKQILIANLKDITIAKQNNLDAALIDRLMLNESRIDGIIQSIEQIISLPDPVGEITDLKYQPSGIQVGKMRTPLGVIVIIYESRPNVTIDAASLCMKSGNVAILRGGKEAINSNTALFNCIKDGIKSAGLDENIVQLITDTRRELVGYLVSASEFIDCVIPRGGKGLVEAISESAKVPVIKHLNGICHTYIDKFADIDKAIQITINGKTRRYGVCNATETLLVHKDCHSEIMPKLIIELLAKGVEIRGCSQTQKLHKDIILATEEDWNSEYLAPIISVKIVNNFTDACNHIDKYSSGHTETIVSENYTRSMEFISIIDSSSVMVNASTAFADGFEYGLGAEIGVSTDKFHVRGPVGLEGLTSQKFIVLGNGSIRE